MSKRAVLYARVSGDDTKNEGRNLTGQLDMCREYAKQNGWLVVKELAEGERGASGALMNLPQITSMLDMASNNEFDIVVGREIDRLAREVGKQYLIESQLKKENIKVA
jgi:DNA invertase Pin-like site-specific DNA recombinase